jgi:hypothetical protein
MKSLFALLLFAALGQAIIELPFRTEPYGKDLTLK